jgi:hypothetical protein
MPLRTFVDHLERRHARPHDAVFGRQVVVAHGAGRQRFALERLLFAGDALQQRIDFVLRKNLLVH